MNIGVVLRKNKNSEHKDILSINYEVFNIINNYGANILGIYDIESLKYCDGVILQGGSDPKEEELNIVRYIYENDIPCLGICLGMQEMALINNGTLEEIGNYKHLSNNKYVHDINIDPLSKLYGILNNEKIKVNSRHKDKVLKTDLNIVAYSNDGIIEAIEDKNKKFFIGLQWHPESLDDEYTKNIFDSFFESIKNSN